ncbi:hypothetical protein C0995_013106 [Termitomyces sp. Mi166|nr:hypothetical protein C0995_013106 [Termitomyces sp. Mi166\
MDFPSIVTSTSDLSPQMLHSGSDDINMTDIAVTSVPPDQTRRPARSLTHLAVISAFLLPFTVFPYVLARRQITALRRQLAETQTSVRILEQELNLSWQEMAGRKDEIQKLQTGLLRAHRERDQQRIFLEKRDTENLRSRSEVQTELQNLVKEAQYARTQGALFSSLGTSLADVAAFMHEIELEMGMLSSNGKDQRGIDRLRSLAFRMQTEARSEPKKIELESQASKDSVDIDDEVPPY